MKRSAFSSLIRSGFIIVLFFIGFFGIVPVVTPTHAQVPVNNPYLAPNTNPNVQQNLHTYTQSVIIELLSSATCAISGMDILHSQQGGCLGVNLNNGKIGYTKGPNKGLADAFIGMISQLYVAPVSGSDYVNYVASNFRPAKQAYAATTGTGFNGLNPFIKIWTAFRNIAYLVYTVIFILIGIAIILRLKIGGNTPLTVQSILPKAIIGIILVTFSYAIAGFFIDIMYILTYLVVYIMAPLDAPCFKDGTCFGGGIDPQLIFNGLNRPPAEMVDKLYNWGPIQFGLLYIPIRTSIGLAHLMAQMLADLISGNGLAKTLPITWTLLILFGVIFNFPCFITHLGFGLGGFSPPTYENLVGCATDAVTPIATLIIFIILYILLLWILFKVWFMLIKAYAKFLIDVILGPFRVIYDINGWLRDMAANLLVFPVVLFMFLLSKIFMDNLNPSDNSLFVPPMVGSLTTSTDNIFGAHTSILGAIAAFAILMLTPNAAEMTQGAVKSAGNKIVGSGIGKGVEVARGLLSSGLAPVAQNMWHPGNAYRPTGWLRQKLQGSKADSPQRRFFGDKWVKSADGLGVERG